MYTPCGISFDYLMSEKQAQSIVDVATPVAIELDGVDQDVWDLTEVFKDRAQMIKLGLEPYHQNAAMSARFAIDRGALQDIFMTESGVLKVRFRMPETIPLSEIGLQPHDRLH